MLYMEKKTIDTKYVPFQQDQKIEISSVVLDKIFKTFSPCMLNFDCDGPNLHNTKKKFLLPHSLIRKAFC